MKMIINTLFPFFADAQSNYKCPAKDGQYEDTVQCDKFYECKLIKEPIKSQAI